MTIESFSGEYRFLSNFFPAKMVHDGIEYPTAEHAFQAAKTLDFQERWAISKLDTPGKAKRAGRKVTLRPDWERVKDRIMYEVILLKFAGHQHRKQRLLDTNTEVLIEGNTWGDTYWGVCNGQGSNMLGKILMRVRAQLR